MNQLSKGSFFSSQNLSRHYPLGTLVFGLDMTKQLFQSMLKFYVEKVPIFCTKAVNLDPKMPMLVDSAKQQNLDPKMPMLVDSAKQHMGLDLLTRKPKTANKYKSLGLPRYLPLTSNTTESHMPKTF